MTLIEGSLARFVRDESGASLAEYLVLLGVLALAVGGGILAFGGAINEVFAAWATWHTEHASPPDS